MQNNNRFTASVNHSLVTGQIAAALGMFAAVLSLVLVVIAPVSVFPGILGVGGVFVASWGFDVMDSNKRTGAK